MNRSLERFSRLARLRVVHLWIYATVLGGLMPTLTYAGVWRTDGSAVLEEAATAKKLVLYAFLGNGWDTASMDLKKEVLNQQKFLEAMNEHYILVELSVPIDSENASDEVKGLMNEYKASIFPAMIVVNSEGKKLDELRYVLKPLKWYLKKFDSLATRHLGGR